MCLSSSFSKLYVQLFIILLMELILHRLFAPLDNYNESYGCPIWLVVCLLLKLVHICLNLNTCQKKISRCHTHIRGNCWKLWMLHSLFWCLGILGRIQCHSWSWFNRGTELIMILNVKCHTGKGLNMNLLGNAHLCRSVACGIYFVQSSATNKFSCWVLVVLLPMFL